LIEKQGDEDRNQNHPENGQKIWDGDNTGGHLGDRMTGFSGLAG